MKERQTLKSDREHGIKIENAIQTKINYPQRSWRTHRRAQYLPNVV